MELVELLRGAQEAMERGDYRLASAACAHAVEAYPSCLTAHRMLGESCLERGEVDLAIQHFERTLSLDPLNVVSRLGMGVAAEERHELGIAYACYLHAWEINPALDQVRDELVRLRGALGSDERLHPTRSGLAAIYARSGQLGRSTAEWQAVLATEPDSRRARTSLAEVVWRSGDDSSALTACKEALRGCPENGRALAMLADVERRRASATANETLERYQAVDPQGEILTILAEYRDDTELAALRCGSALVEPFDFSGDHRSPGVPAREALSSGIDNPSAALAASHMAPPDLWDTLVRDLTVDPAPGETRALAPEGPSLEDEVQPFAWFEEGAQTSEAAAVADQPLQGDSWSSEAEPVAATVSHEVEITQRAEPLHDLIIESLSTAPASRASLADRETVLPPPDPFVTADGRVDLTVGWDDLDRTLKDATPSLDASSDYDALVAELGVAGIAPFDVQDSEFDDGAWDPFTEEDLVASSIAEAGDGTGATEPPSAETERAAKQKLADILGVDLPAAVEIETPVAEIAEVVAVAAVVTSQADASAPEIAAERVYDDLVAAIPVESASGYTDLLRHIDIEAVQDFDSGADLEAIDPLSSPDAAGMPLEFEDLLAVTSKDGTAPLAYAGPTETEEAKPIGLSLDGDEVDWAELSSDIRGAGDIEILPLPIGAGVEAGMVAFASIPNEQGGPGEYDAMLAGLEDLQPFSVQDLGELLSTGSSDVVDFSDINEVAFDPALFAAASSAAPTPWQFDAPVEHVEHVATRSEPEPAAAGGWNAVVAESAAPVDLSVPASEIDVEEGDVVISDELAATLVSWPAFLNHTSELMDRRSLEGSVFGRLRSAKRMAIEAGRLAVDRTVYDLRPGSTFHVEHRPAAPMPSNVVALPVDPSARTPSSSYLTSRADAQRSDLMAMRIRLIEDDSAAEEISQMLEATIGQGISDPLALRVLGEAYLKLGRTEQAAAQFRQAMLARRRAR